MYASGFDGEEKPAELASEACAVERVCAWEGVSQEAERSPGRGDPGEEQWCVSPGRPACYLVGRRRRGGVSKRIRWRGGTCGARVRSLRGRECGACACEGRVAGG